MKYPQVMEKRKSNSPERTFLQTHTLTQGLFGQLLTECSKHYMNQPPNLEPGHHHQSLYDLPQQPHFWKPILKKFFHKNAKKNLTQMSCEVLVPLRF